MPIIFPDEIDRKIVFLGLSGAGKTTLVRRLKDPEHFNPETEATLGVAIELLEFNENDKKTQFLALDCGGQIEFARAIWMPHVQAGDGVVFLFDSAKPESVVEARKWLVEVVNWIKDKPNHADTPILFLANKSDLESALLLDQIVKLLKLNEFLGKSFGIYQISALTGTNVDEALKWFFSRII